MRVDPSIFKTYDIRGTYPDALNAEVAKTLGRAYATVLRTEYPRKRLRIVIGGDARRSTPELKKAFIRGVLESGISVDDAGLVSTPTLYFATGFYGYDGGVQVSASHNPKQWNGFKMTRAKAKPISKHSGIATMQALIGEDRLLPALPPKKRGRLGKRNSALAAEVREQLRFGKPKGTTPPPLKIAIDAGNGVGSLDMKALFAHLPHRVVWLNAKPDGTFPVHEADPMVPENNRQLQETIRAKKCDLGIAIDGDGDRYFFFDETGAPIPQEIVRGLMAQMVLRDHPRATVAYDIRPGRITRELIEEAGGRPIVAPVGHSLIKETMLREKARFGGESSGHFFYQFPYGTFEAPMVLVLNLLRWLAEHPGSVSQAIAPYRRYANSGEINTPLPDREAGERTLDAIAKRYADGTHTTIDGLFVEYDTFWFSTRLGNTGGAVLRLIVEAHDQATMEARRDELLLLITQNP